MPSVYFWLMSEILFFYCLTAFIICYFFRRFCQDPAIKKEIEEEEQEEMEEEMAEAEGAKGKTAGGKGKGKASLDNVPTDDGADDEAPSKPNKTKKAEIPKK